MLKKAQIFLADELHPSGEALLKKRFRVTSVKGLTNDSLLTRICSFSRSGGNDQALIVRSVRNIGKNELNYIKKYTNISLICTVSAGFDNLDIQHAEKLGISVMNVAGANSTSAAEFTWALILAITKRLLEADRSMKAGVFDYGVFSNAELAGKTIGVIGVGNIGSKVAKIARSFEMNVLGNDIKPSLKNRYPFIKFVSLKKLLSVSDIVTIHTPLDSSTRYLINSKNISLMKRNSILINCSRGGTVNEKAMINALRLNKLSYAGIDVFEKEPGVNSSLKKLPNVILTPHLAGKTRESRERMSLIAAEKIINFYTKPGKRAKLIN